jgi:signal transduction histidine kinase
VQVKVKDTGPGFPPDSSRLFEPFYTTKPAGTGLGLPITAKILEVHGGTVSLRNHERGGAEVTLTLTASPRSA